MLLIHATFTCDGMYVVLANHLDRRSIGDCWSGEASSQARFVRGCNFVANIASVFVVSMFAAHFFSSTIAASRAISRHLMSVIGARSSSTYKDHCSAAPR